MAICTGRGLSEGGASQACLIPEVDTSNSGSSLHNSQTGDEGGRGREGIRSCEGRGVRECKGETTDSCSSHLRRGKLEALGVSQVFTGHEAVPTVTRLAT
jgi:hypothetical protein